MCLVIKFIGDGGAQHSNPGPLSSHGNDRDDSRVMMVVMMMVVVMMVVVMMVVVMMVVVMIIIIQ
jgi:hypothetical protein